MPLLLTTIVDSYVLWRDKLLKSIDRIFDEMNRFINFTYIDWNLELIIRTRIIITGEEIRYHETGFEIRLDNQSKRNLINQIINIGAFFLIPHKAESGRPCNCEY